MILTGYQGCWAFCGLSCVVLCGIAAAGVFQGLSRCVLGVGESIGIGAGAGSTRSSSRRFAMAFGHP